MLEQVRKLGREGIWLPVHMGIPGPTPLPKLIRFTARRVIGLSLNVLMRNTSALSNLTHMATTPDEVVTGIIGGLAADHAARMVTPHLFSFDGLQRRPLS